MHDPNFLMESKLDTFGEYGTKKPNAYCCNKLHAKVARSSRSRIESSWRRQPAGITRFKENEESSRESLKEKLKRVVMSASDPALVLPVI